MPPALSSIFTAVAGARQRVGYSYSHIPKLTPPKTDLRPVNNLA